MSDSVQPQRHQPTRLPHPWDSRGKNSGVRCHFLLQCMKVKVKVKSCPTLSDAMDWTYQAPPGMGSSRQECWSGLPLPSPLKVYQFSSVQSLSCVRLFATPWIAASQASLSITNSWSLLKLMPLSRWRHPAISSSVVPFSCPQSLPASGSFPMS